jgi:hypothetical protein
MNSGKHVLVLSFSVFEPLTGHPPDRHWLTCLGKMSAIATRHSFANQRHEVATVSLKVQSTSRATVDPHGHDQPILGAGPATRNV